jgi:copper chaperone CopZ
MENKEFQFRTNINCSGCVATVKSHLDLAEGVCHWEVNTANKDKVLTVKSAGISEQEIIEAVQKAGFKIEPLSIHKM